MTHFMGQGKHVLQRIIMIQQHIRMGLGTGRIGTCPLACIGIDIDPTVLKPFLQNLAVVFSQRSQRFVYRSLCLFNRIRFTGIGYQIGIDVIKMQRLHTQKLLA